MALQKYVGTLYPDAASNTSLTSAWAVPGEFSHFVVEIPANMLVTTTGNVRWLGAGTVDGTYKQILYSNNPATSTSGGAFVGETPNSAAVSGAMVVCEAFQFTPFIKAQFSATCTANTGINVYAKKWD